MTKLEKLLQELCPEGVPYKTLGEIATDVFRGAGITRDQVRETGTPCDRTEERREGKERPPPPPKWL